MLKLVQVACKHCGKSVEVADLLAAAEQPCPHCGLPLLDDKAALMSPSRPARGWTARLIRWTKPLVRLSDWFNGRGILITPDEAMCPPPMVCVQCGATATDVIQGAVEKPGVTLG